MWGLVGISAILLYTGKVHNPDLVWGYAIHDLLGSLKLGLVGFMISSMMAALMSTASALMLTVSGLLLHNVYKPLVPGKTERHYVWTGRILGGAFLIGGALIATQFDSILEILKFVWEFFVIFAAAFWLGLKWRRANRQGAWASILVTLFLFYLLPVLLPLLIPSLKQNNDLLVQTEPVPIVRTYSARITDVEERAEQIAQWRLKTEAGIEAGVMPRELRIGDEFTRTFDLPAKSIFWSKQPVKNEQGILEARGYLFPELFLLNKMGMDLHLKPYALNETLRMLIRLIFPFILLIIVSLLTKQQSDDRSLRFFLKMRTRVRGLGAEVDAKDLEEAYANPEKTETLLAFPNTSLEIYKWNKQDVVGFLISVGVVAVVLGTLFAVVNMGS